MKTFSAFILTLLLVVVLPRRLFLHQQRIVPPNDQSSSDQIQCRRKRKQILPQTVQIIQKQPVENTVTQTSGLLPAVNTPSTIQSTTSTSNIVNPKPKQLVTNPLAQNIIIVNRQEIALQLKQKLDDHTKDYDACPIEKPFYNGNDCITCKDYFNVNTKNCTTCSNKTRYDQSSFKCIKIAYLPNLEASGLLLKNRKLSEWADLASRLIQTSPNTIEKCPIQNPFPIQGQCTKCVGELPLFDLITQTCQKCPAQTQYNPQTKKCESKQRQQNIATTQSVIVPTSVTVTPQQNNLSITDIKTQPNQLVNTLKKYYINPQTYGLIIDGDLQDYVQKTIKLKSQGYEQCPNAKPYFNGKQCIGCAGVDSKFNLSTGLCTRCSENTYYLYSQRKCIHNN